MNILFLRGMSVGLLALACFTPSVALAATPQQVFNTAFSSTFGDTGAWAIDGKMDVHSHKEFLKKMPGTADIDLTYRILHRFLSEQEGKPRNMEGQMVVDASVASSSKTDSSLINALGAPMSLEWKIADSAVYLKIVTKLPSNVTALVGPEVQRLMGQWLRVDLPAEFVELLSSPSEATGNQELKAFLAKNPLRVVRVVGKTKRADGHQIVRYRLELNQALLLKQEQDELKQARLIGMSVASRNQIRQRQAAVRSLLKGFSIVAIVDQTVPRLDRLEFGGTVRLTPSLCRAIQSTQVCQPNTVDTFKIVGGFSFIKQEARPIKVPQTSIDLVAFVKDLMTKNFGTE